MAIAQLGGIAPLIALCMQGSAQCREYGVGALRAMAHNEANKTAIAHSGGLTAFLSMARDGSEKAKAQVCPTAVPKSLNSPANYTSTSQSKRTLWPCFAGPTSHPCAYFPATRQALDALVDLASEESNEIAVVGAGAINPLVALLQKVSTLCSRRLRELRRAVTLYSPLALPQCEN